MTLNDAQNLDARDPLAFARERFSVPDGLTYLDGNSLGALPVATPARVEELIRDQWGEDLISSWNKHGWIDAPMRVAVKLAPIVGAKPTELLIADSTSVCLFKLLMAAGAAREGAILAEDDNFPTDAHVAGRVAELLGRGYRPTPREAVAEALTGDIATAVLTHVDYRTARRHDMAALNAKGVPIVWDLSHSVGAVPLDLGRDGAQLAVGCGYKFLNGGPGAPAFLYVAHDLQAQLASPIAGWWGHKAPFAFSCDFEPAPGIDRFLSGTPAMLGLLALESGVDLMLESDAEARWEKSIRLHDLFAARIAALCPELERVTPDNPDARGSHIAFRHPNALAIVRALIERGVIGDFRTPDIARFGLTPLTLLYGNVWDATEVIAETIASGAWRDPRFLSGGVVT